MIRDLRFLRGILRDLSRLTWRPRTHLTISKFVAIWLMWVSVSSSRLRRVFEDVEDFRYVRYFGVSFPTWLPNLAFHASTPTREPSAILLHYLSTSPPQPPVNSSLDFQKLGKCRERRREKLPRKSLQNVQCPEKQKVGTYGGTLPYFAHCFRLASDPPSGNEYWVSFLCIFMRLKLPC